MATIVRMPKLGMTMEEGKVLKWHKEVGDYVEKDEVLLEIETEKATAEVEAPETGYLRKILGEEGETLEVGRPLAVLTKEKDEEIPLSDLEEKIEMPAEAPEGEPEEVGEEAEALEPSERAETIKASPRARKLARENEINLALIEGTGPDGVITVENVEKYIEERRRKPEIGKEGLEEIPVEGIRKSMAQKMAKSSREAPHATYFVEVDATELKRFRSKIALSIKERTGVRPTYTDIIIKSCAIALEEEPELNARWGEEKIELVQDINVGMATATEEGLIVPVVKDADEKSIEEISKETRKLIEKAKNRDLSHHEVTGGTFTVSNLGMYNIEKFTQIINPPESAILGVGSIVERPRVSGIGEVEVKPVMNLCLSWDHRVMDGVPPARFINRIRGILENPSELESETQKIRPEERKVVVIGSGVGGYTAAIRAAQLGSEVTIVEKDELGGTCLSRGCIPTKTLLKSCETLRDVERSEEYGVLCENVDIDLEKIMERKTEVIKKLQNGLGHLMKSKKIEVLEGRATQISKNKVKVESENGDKDLSADIIIISTGSRPAEVPGIKFGSKSGVISSKEALEISDLPESLLVVGAGSIGVEFSTIFSRLGVDVTLIEMMSQILPREDREVANILEDKLKEDNISIHTSSKIVDVNEKDGKQIAVLDIEDEDEEIEEEYDMVLIATGRKPVLDSLNLDGMGIDFDSDGIKVDDSMKTSVENIFAAGDVTGGYMLAHEAMEEGKTAAESALGLNSEVDYKTIPRVVYSTPEIASIGLTEEEARKKEEKIKIGKFPYTANSKAVCDGEGGMVKIISNEEGEILGGHIIGKGASDLISELSVGVKMKLTVDRMEKTIHPHPTYSESLLEAFRDVFKRSIHI